MIPPTLAAFRKLMQRVAWALDGDWYDKKRDLEMDRDELQALATATPEQLLGIVGEVVEEIRSDAWSAGYAAASDDV